MTARILTGLSLEDYFADNLGIPDMPPTLSASIAKKLVEQTPEQARLAHSRLRTPEESIEMGQDQTAAKRRGTLFHRLVLKKGGDLVLIDAKKKDGSPATDYKTVAAQEQRDKAEAEGKIAVFPEQLAKAQKSADRITARLHDLGIDLDGESEVCVTWEETADDGTVVHCRGMLDHLRPHLAQCVDLKTTDDPSQDTCERHVDSYAHDIQEAAYTSALRHLYPDREPDFVFAFMDPNPPNIVSLAEIDGIGRHYGREKWLYAVNAWAAHLKSGVWPAYYSKTRMRLETKPWARTKWENRKSELGWDGLRPT
jgi:hypothetical protein